MNKKLLAILISFAFSVSWAQEMVPLNSLEAFTGGGGNWSIVGDASASISTKNELFTSPGKGVLACIHEQGKYGTEYELLTKFEHGDMDLSFDFMMSKESNSGVYLQGRYEIQLYDSWGSPNPKYSDAGGIYERWDDSKPKGMEGFEGVAPRVNTAKAPGLWQHMEISFQAPRFDDSGKKITNAKILSVKLNGVTLHENVELTGITRGGFENEVAKGPLRLQGDHGSLAFKNIQIARFDQSPASISNINYVVNYDSYDPNVDPFALEADDKGQLENMTWEFLKQANNFAYTMTGDLNIPSDGLYTFTLYSSANNLLKIDGQEVIPNKYTGSNDARKGAIKLTKGIHQLAFSNAKYDAWVQASLGLFIAGPGFRDTPLTSSTSMIGNKMTDPILVNANSNLVLRSFMDIEKPEMGKYRVVHAASVGSPSGRHYTYDLDKGAVIQVWRGGFLDATPMWNDRGDGSSRPTGSVVLLNDDLLFSKSSVATWPKDTIGTGFKPKGYTLDANDIPTFHYQIYGAKVSDRLEVFENKYFTRTLQIENHRGLFARLASGSKIEQVSPGLYAIDDKNYYIKLNSDSSILIRKLTNSQELLIPITGKELSYSIIY